ncbi:hypothetical protein NST38_30990 [Paenibacillus sp. FSL H8-0104]|uniref:hypothetical protein n=1 Tax=Paenibacillus sp. FSL H8-0104 TaxID=2954509 RepID=UPI0030FDDA97
MLLNEVVFLTGDWDLGSFLANARTALTGWAGLAVALIGIVCIFISIWQIASGLMSHGKKQTNWAISIILLLLGGVLVADQAFDFVQGIAGGGKKTITDLGGTGGAIMLFEYSKFYFFK